MARVGLHTGRRGLGDDSDPFADLLTKLPGTSGAPIGIDPFGLLAVQVNRFTGPAAPADLRVADQPFPVSTGKIDPGAAAAAMVILSRRDIDAAIQFGDAGTNADILNIWANQPFAVAYVTANLQTVTGAIQQYGDSKGLPKASLVQALSKTMLLIAGGVVAAVVLVLRHKKAVSSGR